MSRDHDAAQQPTDPSEGSTQSASWMAPVERQSRRHFLRTAAIASAATAAAAGSVGVAALASSQSGLLRATGPFVGAVVSGGLSADLALTKVVDNPSPYSGGPAMVFTITVTNYGPDTATNVVVNDLLPYGLDFATATASVGSYDPSTGIWTVSSLSASDSATLKITATLNASVSVGQVVTNTATASSDTPDPDSSNNSASANVTVRSGPIADLALSKVVDNPTPHIADIVLFTLTLTNNGPDIATNVVVNDLLPYGLDFATATASVGSYDSSTGLWTVGSLSASDVVTLKLTATLDASVSVGQVVTNTATASSDTPDPDSSNNSASASVTATA